MGSAAIASCNEAPPSPAGAPASLWGSVEQVLAMPRAGGHGCISIIERWWGRTGARQRHVRVSHALPMHTMTTHLPGAAAAAHGLS